MEMDQLYTELILEHNQDKRNKHELAHFTIWSMAITQVVVMT